MENGAFLVDVVLQLLFCQLKIVKCPIKDLAFMASCCEVFISADGCEVWQ